jgi:hypothetical protein
VALKYYPRINTDRKIKRAPTVLYSNTTATFRPIIQLLHDIELNPGPTNPSNDNGCFDLPKKTKGMMIGHLNIRSIKCGTKLDEIKAIQKPTIHVLSLPETWLTDSWTDDMLYIPNYTFVRLDRSTTTSGGGIITYIHNYIPYIQKLDLRSENDESICVEIKPRFISPILIFNVYRPPSADSVHDTCLLEIMNKMTSEHKEQYILGDFNIDLQSSKSKSTTFSKKVRHLGLKQLVTVPTRTEARYHLNPH